MNESGVAVSTPGISLGKFSVVENMRYKNNALYVAGRLVQADYHDVFGSGKIVLTPQTPPAAPTGVSVTVPEEALFKIDWKDNSSDELAFVIERSVDDENNYEAIDTVWSNTITTSDRNVVPLKKYFYRVVAVNDAGVAVSQSVEFTWRPVPVGEIALAVAPLGANQFKLSWTSTAKYSDGLHVQRKLVNETAFTTRGSVSTTTTSFVDDVTPENTLSNT